tara:strand:+ start:81 stop:326 length:246 start_codon:yes stop_codon:yes gene_type:complete
LKPIKIRWKLQQEFQEKKCETALPTDKWKYFDNYLIQPAKENNIRVIGLETDSIQLSLIDKEYDFPNGMRNGKKSVFGSKN